MKRALVLAAVAALLVAGASPAEAAVIKKWSVDAGIHGGWDKIDGDTEWDSNFIAGARIGLSIMPALQIELSYDKISTQPNQDDAGFGDVTIEYTGLRFVGTFFAQEDVNVMPYVAAGVGIEDNEVELEDGSDSLTDDGTYGELTFGARVFVWKSLQIRPEFGFRQSNTLGITQTNAHLTVGVSYMFGGAE